MAKTDKKHLHIVVTEELLGWMDTEAKRLNDESFLEVSRSDVARIAIRRYRDFVEKKDKRPRRKSTPKAPKDEGDTQPDLNIFTMKPGE